MNVAFLKSKPFKDAVDNIINENSKICKMERDIGEVKSDVSTLKSDVSTLKSDVSALKSDVSALKSDVSALKSDVSTLKSDVSALKSDVSIIRSDIASMREQIHTEGLKRENLESKVNAIFDVVISIKQTQEEQKSIEPRVRGLEHDVLLLNQSFKHHLSDSTAHTKRKS